MIIVVLGIILSVAFVTLQERKVMGSMQRRIGPNQVGYQGFQQPQLDGVKQIQKESVLPQSGNMIQFQIAPFLTFYLALANWLFIPLDQNLHVSEINGGGIQILIALTELSIFGVLYGGWSANSKYPLQGSLRSTAQMISYSVNLSLIIQTIIFIISDISLMSLLKYGTYRYLALIPMIFLFILSALAETNRAPADLPEAESEQVAGFFTEHSGIGFVFYFLAEYTSIITISTLFFLFFFGISMSLPFILLILWVRAALPRMRFDQLLSLGWLEMLPLTIGYMICLPSLLQVLSW